ncbi:MAG: sporulation integral membrane protein YtvI [Clostridiales bacterium]|nr:sporulation integral membrane protein YtvI [Clostridiales bacterium]
MSDGDLTARHKRTEGRRTFLINLLYFAVLAALALLAARTILLWLLPFVLAAVTALLLQRPVRWLNCRTRVSRKLYSVGFIVLLVVLLAGLVGLLGWLLIGGTIRFVTDGENIRLIRELIQTAAARLETALTALTHAFPGAETAVDSAVSRLSDTLLGLISRFFSGAANTAVNLTARLPQLLLSFFVWVLASIFLTMDYDRVRAFLLRQLPEGRRPLLRAIREFGRGALLRLLRAYLLLMLITCAELCAGLGLLGVPFFPAAAVLIAAVDILPVLGTGTILLPWALVAFLSGDLFRAAGLVLLYVIVSLVRGILEPRLVSGQIGLHPLVSLLCMFLGLRLAGMAGMLLLPAAAMVLIQLNRDGFLRLWK